MLKPVRAASLEEPISSTLFYTMPIDWSDQIVLANLVDEPEFSEEFAAIFARVEGEGAAQDSSVGVPSVVLNFAEVTHLNSSHLAMLLKLRKRCVEAGRSLVLTTLSDELWSILILTGLDKVFIVAPDVPTGLAGLQLEGDGVMQ